METVKMACETGAASTKQRKWPQKISKTETGRSGSLEMAEVTCIRRRVDAPVQSEAESDHAYLHLEQARRLAVATCNEIDIADS